MWTIGNHDAIGFSPFGVDRSAGPDTALARAYEVMSQSRRVLEHQGTGTMTAVLLDSGSLRRPSGSATTTSKGIIAAQFRRRPAPATRLRCDTFYLHAPDDYVVVAHSVNIYFTAATNPSDSVGLATVEEGVYAYGKWIPGRRLNGDETPEWKEHLSFRGENYSIQHVKLYRYH